MKVDQNLVARVELLAQETFGDARKAQAWLRRPSSLIGNSAPLDLLGTEGGIHEVEAVLAKIAHGIAT